MATAAAIDPRQPTGLLFDAGFEQPNADLVVRSPYSGEELARVAAGSPEDVDRAVAVAAGHLPAPPPAERAAVLERAARLIADRAEPLARTIAAEAGKPIRQARGEAARAVDTLTFAAVAARRLAGEVVPMEASTAGVGKLALTLREPVGVIGAISPFNFPLNLVAHKLAPAIAAGCPVVLKPAEATPLSALALAGILLEAGLPPGSLCVVNGSGSVIGRALVDHPDVAMISFTGSAPVGWDIRVRAPRKHVALELGNSTPVIVTADADIHHAAARIAASAFTHAGQSCISIQRVYVERPAHAALLEALVPRVEALVVGDPMEEETDVGPVITPEARERVLAWIGEAASGGARVVTGGDVVDGMIRPTVVAGLRPEMRLSCEEAFGPVAGVAAYDTADEAVEHANGMPFGLQAGIFTGRVDRALRLAERLRFGGVVINETPTFRADQMPYGVVKESGNTREGPPFAVLSMTEPKLVVVDLSDGTD